MMDLEKLEKKKLKRGVAERGWNKHLFNPLMPEEIVYIHKDQSGIDPKKFVRVVHSSEKVVSVFSKEYFE